MAVNRFENNPAQAEAFAALSQSLEADVPETTRIPLPSQALNALTAVEPQIADFFTQKFAEYGLDFGSSRIPEIIYETVSNPEQHDKKSKALGGYLQTARNGSSFIYVLTAHDILTTATLAAHEVSHGVAYSGVFSHPTSESPNDFMLVLGLEQQLRTGGDYTRNYAALENGMAIMDQMRIRTGILHGIFSDDTSRIENEQEKISTALQTEMTGEEKALFGFPSPDVIKVLTNSKATSPMFLTDTTYESLFAINGYKQVRFTQEIARLLGFILFRDFSYGDGESYMQTGIDFLEQTRLNGSTIHDTLLGSVFSADELAVIKSVDDINTNMTEGMRVLKGKQAEIGII